MSTHIGGGSSSQGPHAAGRAECGVASFSVRNVLSRFFHRLSGRGSRGTRHGYQPACEGFESKTLLSVVLGWTGGSGGNSSSAITPANISSLTQKYTDEVDGIILAQPLTATVNITVGPSPGTQQVVFVATENDSLYAFNLVSGQLLWQTSFLQPGETPLPVSVTSFYPGGITGTPLIDLAKNTIYLVSTEMYTAGNASHYTKTLHAVDMSNGLENPNSPVVIADTGYVGNQAVSLQGPSVPGTGDGSVNGRVYFYVQRELQRPGLSLDGNDLLIAFGAYVIQPPYHGWILAYNINTMKLAGVFNDTPNGQRGGIWNNGNPLQVDSQGYFYTETGNGVFDTTLNPKGFPSKGDYGDSVLKLKLVPTYHGPNGWGIKVVDYFTPDNQKQLYLGDLDLASSGVLILPKGIANRSASISSAVALAGPGPAPAPVPHSKPTPHPKPTPPRRRKAQQQPPANLMLASGKQGTIYVLDMDHMGHFHPASDNIYQELPHALGGGSFDTPTIFDNTIYYAGVNDVLKAFNFVNGQLVQTGQASNVIPPLGASPVFSSDGTQNGIIWVTSTSDQMFAYNAADLSNELWSTNLVGYSEFSIPNITSTGQVELAEGTTLVGYGL
jgi:hypothetical protein